MEEEAGRIAVELTYGARENGATARLPGRRRDGAFNAFDMLMMVPSMAMPAEKARDYLEGCEKMAATQQREGLDAKVNSWIKGVLISDKS
ncbi:hypothetical protein J3R83DRAFT_4666 [Lanmaoa asiatica]|nr:hypothetical protein J3R83DRAFT_4666 [Lanmaoa asiatica]